jgi:hypothetical protein
MILLFNLLVFSLLAALVLCLVVESRERRQRTPAAVKLADLPTPPTTCREPSANGVKRVVGLSAEEMGDGVRLMFYIPPNRVGRTSPITHLVSTRCDVERGTLYEMKTSSGSSYVVVMDDDHAKQVLRTFYGWRNGTENGHCPNGGPAGRTVPRQRHSR